MNKCMAEFMNVKLKFREMSRLERISCTKELRNAMEIKGVAKITSFLKFCFRDLYAKTISDLKKSCLYPP